MPVVAALLVASTLVAVGSRCQGMRLGHQSEWGNIDN